jgi:hypothetical protein
MFKVLHRTVKSRKERKERAAWRVGVGVRGRGRGRGRGCLGLLSGAAFVATHNTQQGSFEPPRRHGPIGRPCRPKIASVENVSADVRVDSRFRTGVACLSIGTVLNVLEETIAAAGDSTLYDVTNPSATVDSATDSIRLPIGYCTATADQRNANVSSSTPQYDATNPSRDDRFACLPNTATATVVQRDVNVERRRTLLDYCAAGFSSSAGRFSSFPAFRLSCSSRSSSSSTSSSSGTGSFMFR